MVEPQTLKNESKNKILEIGHLILQSLGGHQAPDSALLAKEELPGSIKVRLLTSLRSSLRMIKFVLFSNNLLFERNISSLCARYM